MNDPENLTVHELIADIEERLDETLEAAWLLIANAWNGNWDEAPREWKILAEDWRTGYHGYLAQRNGH